MVFISKHTFVKVSGLRKITLPTSHSGQLTDVPQKAEYQQCIILGNKKQWKPLFSFFFGSRIWQNSSVFTKTSCKNQINKFQLCLRIPSLSLHTILLCFGTVLKVVFWYTTQPHRKTQQQFSCWTRNATCLPTWPISAPLWNAVVILTQLYPPALSYPHLRREAW